MTTGMANLFKLLVGFIAIAAATTIRRQPEQYYLKAWSEGFDTIAIIATNDIHGSVFPTKMRRTDNLEIYTQGGLTVLGTMINAIRKQLGQHNVMYLDAGDQFQGAIESGPLISKGEIISTFFNEIGLTASTIGNHEFDFPPSFLHNYMSKRQAPFLSANIFNEKGQPAQEFLPNTLPSKLFEVGNGIKIGVVGLTTTLTPQTATGFTDQLYPKYEFRDYKPFVLEESMKLRKSGAHCIVLLGHLGARCPSNLKHQNRTKKSQQSDCDQDDLTILLDSLPKGTVDAVVAGHIHEVAHHYHKGVPVVCSKNAGTYFNILYLKFEKYSHHLRDTFIDGPVPVCQRKFQHTGNCDYLQPHQLKDAGKLVHWRFHGAPVVESQRLLRVFDRWHVALEPYFTKLADNYVYLTRIRHQESQLANLFVDMIYQAAHDSQDVKIKPDFGILNAGTLRTTWLPGEIVYKDVYAMIPFDNLLVTFGISGENLDKLVKVIHKGGWTYGFRGIKVKLTKKPYEVVQVLTNDGNPLDPNKWYTGVITDFLLEGGDGFKHLMDALYHHQHIHPFGSFRDHIAKQVAKLKVIAGGRLDPTNPRMSFLPAPSSDL